MIVKPQSVNTLLTEGLIIAQPQRGYFVDADETQSELRKEMIAFFHFSL